MQELLDLGLKTQGFFIGTHDMAPRKLFLAKAGLLAQALTPKWGRRRQFQEARMK
jgi:hypothetical protein